MAITFYLASHSALLPLTEHMKPAPALGSFSKKILLHNLKVVKSSKITRSTVAFNQKGDSSISDIFDSWCREHGKTYNSQEEREHRMRVFEERYKRVNEDNEKCDPSYTRGLNKFSDLTVDELMAKYRCGCIPLRILTMRRSKIRSDGDDDVVKCCGDPFSVDGFEEEQGWS